MTIPVTETMTPVEPSTPAEPVEDSTAPPDELEPPANDSLDLPDNLDAARKVRNENRTLRERSKTAEGERDALRAEVDRWRRQAIEGIAAGELRDVRDFADRHPDPAEFLGEDGQLDTDAVLAAAKALAAERPHYAPERVTSPPPSVRPIESLRPGASGPAEPQPGASWGSVLGRSMGQPAGYGD